MKTDVVFWISNVVTKSGNTPFWHFQLNIDNSEAKFPLVFKSDQSWPKSRVPEPTSRPTSNWGRLVRMVDQNDGKFEHLWKLIKKIAFYPNRKMFSQKFIRWNVELDEHLWALQVLGTQDFTIRNHRAPHDTPWITALQWNTNGASGQVFYSSFHYLICKQVTNKHVPRPPSHWGQALSWLCCLKSHSSAANQFKTSEPLKRLTFPRSKKLHTITT